MTTDKHNSLQNTRQEACAVLALFSWLKKKKSPHRQEVNLKKT